MLFVAVGVVATLAAGLFVCANYSRAHLVRLPAEFGSVTTKKQFRLPWIKFLLLATPFYFAAMYWASISYVPNLLAYSMPGRPESEIIPRPYGQLLDSKFAVVGIDLHFGNDAAIIGETRSNILLYEDGNLLGPPHMTHYEVAVLGMGRYAHSKSNNNDRNSLFVFSSSDNTDPNTNGRVYWAERPTKQSYSGKTSRAP
jgi:hypothetical protein